jgi:hypothetical protein
MVVLRRWEFDLVRPNLGEASRTRLARDKWGNSVNSKKYLQARSL